MDNIRKKLQKLVDLDQKQALFGANSHKYQLNPVLTEAELAAYEARHDLKLPEDYRQYLATVANGGAGPFYGLMALEDNDDATIDPAAEFAYTRENPLVLVNAYDELGAQTADMDEDEAEEFEEEFYDKLYGSVACGLSYLAHEGCGMYSALVLKGPEYGNVWYVDLANDAGAYPLTSPKNDAPMGFAEWYELWLDHSIEHLEQGHDKLMGYGQYIK